MAVIGGGLFLIAIFASIFITPFVLGAYVVVGDQREGVLKTYFGFIAAVFALLVGVGIVATLALVTA